MTTKTHNRKWIDNHCKITGRGFAYVDDASVGVWLNGLMEKTVVGKRTLEVIPHDSPCYPFKMQKKRLLFQTGW